MINQVLQKLEHNTKSNLIKKDIINYFLNNGHSTIAEISKDLGLSVPTITKQINSMTEDSLIADYGKFQTAEGRHPNIFGLNSEAAYFIGVDMAHRNLNIALMDFGGHLVRSEMNIQYLYENTNEKLDELCAHVLNFINELPADIQKKIVKVNLNIPGRVNPKSGYSYIIFYLSDVPLSKVMSEKLQYSVGVDNDTRAMAYGEYIQGVQGKAKDVIFINMSWGLGIGIIIDGKPFYGKSGFSGEFGHFPAFDNEIICPCGKKGCIETEASGRAIHGMVLERIKRGESSLITTLVDDLEKITLSDIICAVKQEDTMCIEIVEEVGAKLGRYVAGLINIFNPELLVIGGQMAETGPFLMLPIKGAIQKFSLNLVNKDSEIVLSKLKDKAGVYGACLLARNNFIKK
ncbi:MAG: ROK family transcriptional regulator [Paludibacter sp.]|jgi:predicted NBD/HSP70 family sugar kinase